MSAEEHSGVSRVVNTPFILLRNDASHRYYLKAGQRWVTALELSGQWADTTTVPPSISAVAMIWHLPQHSLPQPFPPTDTEQQQPEHRPRHPQPWTSLQPRPRHRTDRTDRHDRQSPVRRRPRRGRKSPLCEQYRIRSFPRAVNAAILCPAIRPLVFGRLTPRAMALRSFRSTAANLRPNPR